MVSAIQQSLCSFLTTPKKKNFSLTRVVKVALVAIALTSTAYASSVYSDPKFGEPLSTKDLSINVELLKNDTQKLSENLAAWNAKDTEWNIETLIDQAQTPDAFLDDFSAKVRDVTQQAHALQEIIPLSKRVEKAGKLVENQIAEIYSIEMTVVNSAKQEKEFFARFFSFFTGKKSSYQIIEETIKRSSQWVFDKQLFNTSVAAFVGRYQSFHDELFIVETSPYEKLQINARDIYNKILEVRDCIQQVNGYIESFLTQSYLFLRGEITDLFHVKTCNKDLVKCKDSCCGSDSLSQCWDYFKRMNSETVSDELHYISKPFDKITEFLNDPAGIIEKYLNESPEITVTESSEIVT